MRNIRIIPRLDVKGPNLVKGVRFEGLRVLGPPEYFARQYYREGADELIYMDIVASLYGRNNLEEIVKRTAKYIFIPITVGGGIRSVEDIRTLLRAGADKVAINTAAIQNPALIREGARTFGSQCIVVSIEAKKIVEGKYEAFTDNGRQETGVDVFEWAQRAYELGAGEILVTSVDREGTGEGYDIDLVSKISELVPIPVIACGGAGRLKDIEEVIKYTKINAVSAASVFHYNQLTRDLTSREYEEGNIEFLKKFTQTNYDLKRIQPLSITELKLQLKKIGSVHIRSAEPEDSFKTSEEILKNNFNMAVKGESFVAVVDYGCGNLFSIEHALKEIGANFKVSSNPKVVMGADKLLLPGVGAFGDGMKNLIEKGLIEPIKEHVRDDKPLLGICLGMQLLMSEGEEFGLHRGLDFIKGKVSKLEIPQEDANYSKIPHIGWNQIKLPRNSEGLRKKNGKHPWKGTILENVPQESTMYFIHSYVVVPDNPFHILAETEYANRQFCSVIWKNNIYGCQFHPERSGATGLNIYRQFIFGIHKETSQIGGFKKQI